MPSRRCLAVNLRLLRRFVAERSGARLYGVFQAEVMVLNTIGTIHISFLVDY